MYNSKCRSYHTLKIAAERGQNISLTLITLSQVAVTEQMTFGVIVDDTTQDQFPMTANKDTQTIGLSKTHTVSVLLEEAYEHSRFLIGYQGKVHVPS